MAFSTSTNYLCTTFKQGLMNGDFDFSSGTSHVYKIALYTNSADGTDFGGDTTAMDASVKYYSSVNEVSASGSGGNPYVAGGGTLTVSANPTISGTTVYIDFDDETFTNATITARGALIYRSDGGAPTNNAVAVLTFGSSDIVSTAGDFTIQFPTADASNAIVRLA